MDNYFIRGFTKTAAVPSQIAAALGAGAGLGMLAHRFMSDRPEEEKGADSYLAAAAGGALMGLPAAGLRELILGSGPELKYKLIAALYGGGLPMVGGGLVGEATAAIHNFFKPEKKQ